VKFIACSADAVVADNPHHARSDLPLFALQATLLWWRLRVSYRIMMV
jgi:hypothetical protein